MFSELLIGCGSNKVKKIFTREKREWENLTTLDMLDTHKPDVIWNLVDFPYPFENESFDEIHAYDVLEHCGTQGDFEFFFRQFNEFYRILRPGGLIAGMSPDASSRWAWGDPGHTRIIQPELFYFLNKKFYEDEVGKTSASDYRPWLACDFEPKYLNIDAESKQFIYILEAKK